MDASGRIYTGPREKLESYAIFGQPVLAVANALVVSVIDGQPEQTPENDFPATAHCALVRPDGNSIHPSTLGRSAMHALCSPSAHVYQRDHTAAKRSRSSGSSSLELVEDTGNSIALPHLHFQVTDGPSSLSSQRASLRDQRFCGDREIPRHQKPSIRRKPMGLRCLSTCILRRRRLNGQCP